jgi:hypothetical protein
MPTQTTSVGTDNGGVVYWRGGSLPAGACALTFWARVADWSGGDTHQDFLTVNLSGGANAVFRVNRSNGHIEVNESSGGATSLVSGSSTDWAFYAFRFSGSAWEGIRSATGSSSLTKISLTTLGSATLGEIVVFRQYNLYDIRGATVRLLDGTVTDSDLLTLKASDVELSPGSSTSVGFWPFSSHSTANDDQSSTAVDLGVYWAFGSPVTVSDTPYSSAPDFGGTDVECATETGSGNLVQCHALGGTDVECSSEVGSGNVTQRHALGATDVECSSEVGSGAFLQLHLLGGTGVECFSEVGSGAIAGTELGGVDIECLSEAGSGALAQNHAFGGTGVECASAVGSGILPAVDGVEFVPAERRFAVIREIRSFPVLAESRTMRA